MSNSLPKQKKLVLISEAAHILGVSIDTVRRWDKSGVLHSVRLDGKNRCFSLAELKKFQSDQPLSISEAAAKLGVSRVTLRRLEVRGLIKPKRNSAGIRVYDSSSLKSFSNSDYYLRRIQSNKNSSEAISRKASEPAENNVSGNEPETPQQSDFAKSIDDNIVSEVLIPAHEWKAVDVNLSPLQRLPEFLIVVVIFLLLFAFGIKNVTTAPEEISHSDPVSLMLSMIEDKMSNTTFTSVLSVAEVKTDSTPTPSEVPVAAIVPDPAATFSAFLSQTNLKNKTKKIVTVEIKDGSESVNIRGKPMISSEKIGAAQDGDIFEFISIESGWYEIRLEDRSTGFISSAYAQKGEVETK